MAKDCDRSFRRFSRVDQSAGPVADRRHSHVKHERAGKGRERAIIQAGRRLVLALLSGHQRHGGGRRAMTIADDFSGSDDYAFFTGDGSDFLVRAGWFALFMRLPMRPAAVT